MNTDKQKYEREIEEILARYEKDKEPERKKRDSVSAPIRGVITPRPTPGGIRRPTPPGSFNWRRLSSGQYIAAAFGVAFLALFVRNFSPFIASVLVIVAAALFLLPIFLYWSSGTTGGGWSTREEKRWRGQVIDFNTRRDITEDPLANIKRWFRRRR